MSRVLLEAVRPVYASSIVLSLGERRDGARADALEAARVVAAGGGSGPTEEAVRAREDVLVLSLFGAGLRLEDYAAGRVPFTEALLTVRDCRALQMLLASALPAGATYFTRPLVGDFGAAARRRQFGRGEGETSAMVAEVGRRRR